VQKKESFARMRIKWKKKTYTLLIIPDANQPVARVRLSNIVVVSALVVLALLIMTALTVYALHLRSIVVTQQLRAELAGNSQHYETTLADKEQTINHLQNEIIKLAQQTKDMQSRVDEMTKLESDLKSISGTGGSSPASGQASGGAGGKSQGGAFVPVTDSQVEALSASTSDTLARLSKQLTELQTSMTATKQKVLEQQHLLRITPSLYPTMTRTITSPFGYRIDPINGLPSFHSGIDFGASLGDDVFATADGTVVSVGKDASHGNNIVINHGQGLKTWYMHLSKILVAEGDQVTKGQKIGLVGNTGRSTGAHLHYEVLKNGQSIDPKPYLQTMRKDDQ
jgi:murein DD-endopeptidase MepM/ murein hydrolase activator NlpD